MSWKEFTDGLLAKGYQFLASPPGMGARIFHRPPPWVNRLPLVRIPARTFAFCAVDTISPSDLLDLSLRLFGWVDGDHVGNRSPTVTASSVLQGAAAALGALLGPLAQTSSDHAPKRPHWMATVLRIESVPEWIGKVVDGAVYDLGPRRCLTIVRDGRSGQCILPQRLPKRIRKMLQIDDFALLLAELGLPCP